MTLGSLRNLLNECPNDTQVRIFLDTKEVYLSEILPGDNYPKEVVLQLVED